MFFDAIDIYEFVGQPMITKYIYGHIKNVIETMGLYNVVQVITNNASNYKVMGDLVMRDYPSFVWTPCATHYLDLLIANIAKLPWVKDVITKAKHIVNFTIKKPKVWLYTHSRIWNF
jgi:hypothetical protein